MRILVADAFSESHLERLIGDGHSVDYRPELSEEKLPGALDDHDVLVVRSTPVTAAAVEASETLSMIIRAGAGTNTIDTDAAASRGIYVSNTPGRNSIAVAELTMGLITAVDRNIPDNVAELRAGHWDKQRFSRTEGLAGRTLGIVGIGEIGIEVARRARGFAMEVVVIDKPRPVEIAAALNQLGCLLVPDLEALVAESDVISFHIPATPETHGVLGPELLAKAKPGAVIINTARGELIDEDALIVAMDEKGIRAGLDVFTEEPGEGTGTFTSKLAQHPNVYGTHHIGASTEQAQRAIADEVVALVNDFAVGEIRNCVNLQTGAAGVRSVAVRHYNRVGVLVQILGVLRRAGLNVEHMENRIFAGATAASVTIQVAGNLTDEVVADVDAIDEVIAITVS